MRRDIFQAIADPTRRAIITLIAMTPGTLAAQPGDPFPNISNPY